MSTMNNQQNDQFQYQVNMPAGAMSGSQKTLTVTVIPCGNDKPPHDARQVGNIQGQDGGIYELQLETNGENSLKTILLSKKTLW